MEAIQNVTCKDCHWSLWTEDWKQYEAGAVCPRCDGPVIVGKRPDDHYPNDARGSGHLRESDPHIAVVDTSPS
jgi:NAD-dependent SIR2 family protein deacetylase